MGDSEHVIELPALAEREGVFRDRAQAGEVLAGMLAELRSSSTLLLAIPAGGVPEQEAAELLAGHRRARGGGR